MKWIVCLCVLAVYSVQAMPSKEEEEQAPVEEVAVESNNEEEVDGVKSRDKRSYNNYHDSDPKPEPDLDVDVNVNVNVPQKDINADIDVNVNINAEKEEEEDEGVPSDSKVSRQESCDCSASLKEQAIDLAEDVNQLLDSLYELKEEAAANNGTIGAGPRISGATALLTGLEENIYKTAGALTKAWTSYCYWKHYYWWIFHWQVYVCEQHWDSGRKKRSFDYENMNNEEPTCITSNLASVLTDVAEEIKQAVELRDTVTKDPALSAYVLLSIDQSINILLQYLPFINNLTNDLNDLPC